MTTQPQKITLNPIQMLQITENVLGQLKTWLESKQGTLEDSHPHETIKAITSVHHARLICGVRTREIFLEIQKAQQAKRDEVERKLPTPNQLNLAAARVQGQNTAAKTIDDLWRDAGLSHYIDVGRP